MVGLTLCRSFQQCTNSNSANNMRATFCAAFLFLMTRMQQSMANLATRLNRHKIGHQQFFESLVFPLASQLGPRIFLIWSWNVVWCASRDVSTPGFKTCQWKKTFFIWSDRGGWSDMIFPLGLKFGWRQKTFLTGSDTGEWTQTQIQTRTQKQT